MHKPSFIQNICTTTEIVDDTTVVNELMNLSYFYYSEFIPCLLLVIISMKVDAPSVDLNYVMVSV